MKVVPKKIPPKVTRNLIGLLHESNFKEILKKQTFTVFQF